jgi:hypothetical protein
MEFAQVTTTFPDADLRRLLTKRTPLQHERVPFVVLWSQKAGCTSVLKWFLWHAGLLQDALEYKRQSMDLSVQYYKNDVLQTRPGVKDQLVKRITARTPVINFMRCPYGRAFSSYMHLQNRFFIKLEKDGTPNIGLEVRHQILQWVYGSPVPIEYPFSFLDYLQWLQGQDMTEVEPHHALQWAPLYQLPGVTQFRLEEFADVIPRLEHQYALKSTHEEKNLFSSSHHLNKGQIPGTAILKVLERGIALRRTDSYVVPKVNRELLQGSVYGDLIESVFRKDIETYDAIA